MSSHHPIQVFVSLAGVLVLGAVVAGTPVQEAVAPGREAAASGQEDAAPRQIAADAMTPATEGAIARAEAAIRALQVTLVGRLTEEWNRGGASSAVTVCRDEAQVLTRKVAAEHDVVLGRTSHRLRNPVNAAPAWAVSFVAAHAGKRAADVAPVNVDLGDRVGVLRPIGTMEMCTACHGDAAAVSASLGSVLRDAYPTDKAVGFGVGDLRGWMWAEARRSPD